MRILRYSVDSLYSKVFKAAKFIMVFFIKLDITLDLTCLGVDAGEAQLLQSAQGPLIPARRGGILKL